MIGEEATPKTCSAEVPHGVLASAFAALIFHAGAKLHEILRAGEWRSPAFMEYLDLHQLEQDCVLEAHLDESSDEDTAGQCPPSAS